MTGKIEFDLRGIGTELKERLLAVPIYQRSFAWNADEVAEFWGDLRSAFSESATEYFLGTIVLTRQGMPPRDTIIDGQQRLATASILLAAIRDEFKERGDLARAEIVQKEYLAKSDLATATEVSRLNLNSEDSSFFDGRIVSGGKTPSEKKPSHIFILEAYRTLREQVRKVADDAGPDWPARLTSFVTFLAERVVVISLKVPTDSDAFLIFETLNDRGADLTIADLLKNYLFSLAGGKLDVVRDGWMHVLGALDVTAENELFTNFLRHYWSSKHGAIRERELYKSIKDNVATQALAVAFAGELQDAAVLYAAILSADHEHWEKYGPTVRENVETLTRLELAQNRPLLLAAMQHLDLKEKRKLLRLLVSWSVRGLVFGGIGGGTAEKAYCSAAVKIRKGVIKTAAQVLAEIAAIVPSDENFRTAFEGARVPKASLARYFLVALERGNAGDPEPEMVPNKNEEEVNLEHVLPKGATEKDWGKSFTAEERKIYVHRVGNLALLKKGPNGRIGNKAFAIKKPTLVKSKLVLTAQVAAEKDWTPATIVARQKSLAKLAVKVWPRA